MLMVNLKEMESTSGKMGQFIKGSLRMELGMVMDSGILDNKNMRVNILMIVEMEKVSINGETKAIIKVILLTIKDMDTGKCIGIKQHFIKVNGDKEYNQDRGKYGKTGK